MIGRDVLAKQTELTDRSPSSGSKPRLPFPGDRRHRRVWWQSCCVSRSPLDRRKTPWSPVGRGPTSPAPLPSCRRTGVPVVEATFTCRSALQNDLPERSQDPRAAAQIGEPGTFFMLRFDADDLFVRDYRWLHRPSSSRAEFSSTVKKISAGQTDFIVRLGGEAGLLDKKRAFGRPLRHRRGR